MKEDAKLQLEGGYKNRGETRGSKNGDFERPKHRDARDVKIERYDEGWTETVRGNWLVRVQTKAPTRNDLYLVPRKKGSLCPH